MNWVRDRIDIAIARLSIWNIKRGYGADCPTKDTDDFEDLKGVPINDTSRCGSCRAREVVEWLEDHIKLIKS